MSGTAIALLDPDGGPPRLVDPGAPVLRADDLGVLRGESVFETARIANGRPAFLAAHLRRLARSAGRVAVTLPAGWERLAEAATRAYASSDGVLRLVCSKGPVGGRPVGFALASPLPPEAVTARRLGVRAVTLTLGVSADVRAGAPWLLGGVKSTSYAMNMATIRHAQDSGAEDAIWISADGEVLEAPTATVAWVRRGQLVTPPAEELGLLTGTTLEVVLELCRAAGIDYAVRRAQATELADADEVMLMSSVRGVAPVVRLDQRALAIGPVTAHLGEAFEAALVA